MRIYLGMSLLLLLIGSQVVVANQFQKCRAEFKSKSGEVVVSKDICPSEKPVQRKISSIDMSPGTCQDGLQSAQSCMLPNEKITPIKDASFEPYSLKLMSVGIY